MKIALAADHGGFQIKEHLKKKLKLWGHEAIDVGCFGFESVDYPDYGLEAAKLVVAKNADRAILLCKTGIGMSIVANKVAGIRGALCSDESMAESSRRHNDANVLVLAASRLDEKRADEITEKWLKTEFEGGRHQRRINKINQIEKNP